MEQESTRELFEMRYNQRELILSSLESCGRETGIILEKVDLLISQYRSNQLDYYLLVMRLQALDTQYGELFKRIGELLDRLDRVEGYIAQLVPRQ